MCQSGTLFPFGKIVRLRHLRHAVASSGPRDGGNWFSASEMASAGTKDTA